MKKLIRLTESDLHRIVNESVNKILNEILSPEEIAAIDAAYADEDIDFEEPIERPERRHRNMELYTVYETYIDVRHPDEHKPWRMIERDATFDDVTSLELDGRSIYCGNGTDKDGNYWFETCENDNPYIRRRIIAVKDD